MKLDWTSRTVGDIQYFTYVGSGCDIQVSAFKAVNGRVQANIDRFEVYLDDDHKTTFAFAALTKALMCRPSSVHINVMDEDSVNKAAAAFWQQIVHKFPTRDGIIIVDAPTLKQTVGRYTHG